MSAGGSRLLLHVCCGPCAIYPIKRLAEGWTVTAYYFNPNVHPQDEYARRLSAAKQFCEKEQVRFLAAPYDPEQYHRAIGQDQTKPQRCLHCYQLRLSAAAATAAELQFEAFTTTLLISPFQDREALVSAGHEAANRAGVDFLPDDFRDGYREAQDESRRRAMYRQKYCGCSFSQTEAAEEREKR